MRINVANDFAQPIFQSLLQIHIMLGLPRGENTGFEMPKVHLCWTNPRLSLWHGWSLAAAELLPQKQLWNPEKAISTAGERTDESSEVRALKTRFTEFPQSVFLSLGKALKFSYPNPQVKTALFTQWRSRQGASRSSGENAGYLSALGAWENSRGLLQQGKRIPFFAFRNTIPSSGDLPDVLNKVVQLQCLKASSTCSL